MAVWQVKVIFYLSKNKLYKVYFLDGDRLESVVIYRKKRIGRVSKLLFSMLGISITAIAIAISGNSRQRKSMNEMCQRVFGSVGTIFSLEMVQSYSPSLKYAAYEASGKTAYANWEQELLCGKLGKKQNTILQVVKEIENEAEKENIQEASILDHTLMIDRIEDENEELKEVGIIHGENYFEQSVGVADEGTGVRRNKAIINRIKQLKDTDYLVNQLYIVDSSASINKAVFNVDKLLKKDCTISQSPDKPQILLYHTHGCSESFIDSDGSEKESIIGVGDELARLLTEEYGFNVIHDTTCYDMVGGRESRDGAYERALPELEKILKKYPSIEVMIDLHRDSGKKRVTTIDGKQVAQVMLFNGLCIKPNGQSRSGLYNKNLQSNVAFSLQTEMKGMEMYPDLFRRIYVKGFRFNMHLKEKSLLIELGTDHNTITEARNAMKPLAEVLNEVLNE